MTDEERMIYGAEEIEKDDTRRNDMEWDDEYEDFEDEEYENLTADVDMIPAMQAYNKTCNLCGKMYEQYTVPQKLGFKVKEYDICPYCQGSNGESMSIEFFNSP